MVSMTRSISVLDCCLLVAPVMAAEVIGDVLPLCKLLLGAVGAALAVVVVTLEPPYIPLNILPSLLDG